MKKRLSARRLFCGASPTEIHGELHRNSTDDQSANNGGPRKTTIGDNYGEHR